MTNQRAVMGRQVNSKLAAAIGWITVGVTTLATVGLVVTWVV
jgi:hypothetical protein